MVEFDMLLGIIIHIITIILLVIGVIIGIKLIGLLDYMHQVVENVEDKVNSLNGLFKVINSITTSVDLVGDKIVSIVSKLGNKIFKRKKEEDEDE